MIVVPLIARGALKGALNIYRLGANAALRGARVRAREVVRRRGRARARQRADPRAARAPRADRLADRPLQPPLLPRPPSLRADARLALARLGRGADVRPRRLQARQRRLRPRRRATSCSSQLARLARETVRGSDVVCRIGGEEFGVIMPSCDAGDALGLAARLTERLARDRSSSPPAASTVSIGVSQGPQHAMNPRELIACAEAAMMTAKAHGKNQTVLYDDGATERPAPTAVTTARDVRSIAHLKMLQSLAGKLNRLNDVRQIGEHDRDRAAAADRLPQLPRRPAARRRPAADRVRRRLRQRASGSAADVYTTEGRRGRHGPRGRDRRGAARAERARVRVRVRGSPAPPSSRSRWRSCRCATARASPARS